MDALLLRTKAFVRNNLHTSLTVSLIIICHEEETFVPYYVTSIRFPFVKLGMIV